MAPLQLQVQVSPSHICVEGTTALGMGKVRLLVPKCCKMSSDSNMLHFESNSTYSRLTLESRQQGSSKAAPPLLAKPDLALFSYPN